MLPAYARQVVAERDAGRHPPAVMVGTGPTWFRRRHHLYPFVFALEDQVLAGRLDWWWLRGLPVVVESEASIEATLQLAGELADHAAPVLVTYTAHFIVARDVVELMHEIRAGTWLQGHRALTFDGANGGHCQYWSHAREERYLERREARARFALQPAEAPAAVGPSEEEVAELLARLEAWEAEQAGQGRAA